MKKAVLSNRIFLEVEREYGDFLKEELTYAIPSYNTPDQPLIIRNFNVIREGLMSIPVGRIDLIPEGYEIKDKRQFVPAKFPEFHGTLRESQQLVYDQLDDNCIINAKPSWGKAQPCYSLIRVPEGWTSMGDISVGDEVITPKNTIAKVIAKYEHRNKPIYEVTFIDGRITHACGEHLWEVYKNRCNSPILMTTEDLLNETRLLSEGRLYIPLTSSISDSSKEHIIAPYLLGFLLGDGGLTNTVTLSTADVELLPKLSDKLPAGHTIKHRGNYDYGISSSPGKDNIILNELRRLGLIGKKSHEKFIPNEYLFDSLENKLELLQGLLDSDGSVEASGKIEFCTTSRRLILGFEELIRSFGGSVSISSRTTNYNYKGDTLQGRVSYRGRPTRLNYEVKSQLFYLARKRNRIKPGKLDNINKLGIKSIEYLGQDNCACIQIDDNDHLYLTDDYIVTHNTYAGLNIASKLGQKTLVVVHTVPLRNQWAREVEKVYKITPGIVGSSKFNIEPPIVIGNVQSLYNCMPRIQKEFGTVILDEMHHVSSPTFAKVIDKCYSRYKIGLSGTIKRKDGKDVMFCDYFGKKIFKPPPENAMTPEVDVIDCGITLPEVIGNNWAQRINLLMDMPEYRALIMRLADYYAAKGHKILVVQDRVEFAIACTENRKKAVAITGLLKEGREEEMERIFTDMDEIWGITSIFKEGISKDNLSCLILAGPINNDPMLEQLVGRIQRPMPDKQQPRIVDIKLSGWTGSKQFQARLGFYMRMGYKINYI